MKNRILRRIVVAMNYGEIDRGRGVFLGSIIGIWNHLRRAEKIVIDRFDGGVAPDASITDSNWSTQTQSDGLTDRFKTDGRISNWAKTLTPDVTGRELAWLSSAISREMHKPIAHCITRFFNHQTRHRFQVRTVLMAAWQTPDETDLFTMPEGA